MTVHSTY